MAYKDETYRQTHVALYPDQHKDLRDIASESRSNVSQLVRSAVELYLIWRSDFKIKSVQNGCWFDEDMRADNGIQ